MKRFLFLVALVSGISISSLSAQEKLSFEESVLLSDSTLDRTFHKVQVCCAEFIKQHPDNVVKIHSSSDEDAIILCYLNKPFLTENVIKNITDKVSNIPIIGKKAKTISGYTNAGLDGIINCYLTVRITRNEMKVTMDNFNHFSNSDSNGTSMSQGAIYSSEPETDNAIELLNKGQYSYFLKKALPLCQEWWQSIIEPIRKVNI